MAAGTIDTLAGTGTPGFTGDGGPANQATLCRPSGVFAHGNAVFVADTGNHVVRVVDAAGVISRFAGTRRPGYSGDGGRARAARLRSPSAVWVTPDGSCLIADTGNDCIRRVDPDGRITTLATSVPLRAPGGVCAGATASSSVYVADTLNHRICRLGANGKVTTIAGTGRPGYSGDGGPARSGKLRLPRHLAMIGTDRLVVADSGNHVVRQIDLTTKVITTLAGNARAGGPLACTGTAATGVSLPNVCGVAWRDDGLLFLAVPGSDRSSVVLTAAQAIVTFAGEGAPGYAGDGDIAGLAQLNSCSAVATSADDTCYIADTGNHCIRRAAYT